MQSVPAAFTAEEDDSTRSIAHNLLVSWKKDTNLLSRTFTIGVSAIGSGDIIGITPGAVGGPGIYRYFDESEYVMSLGWERSLSQPIGGLNKALAEALLDNTSNRFTPQYAGGRSELYTSVLPRRPMIINAGFHYGGINNVIPQFAGILDRQPEVDLRTRTVRLSGADYVDFFANRYLDNSIMFTSQSTDSVLESAFDLLGMSTSQYELEPGLNIIKFGHFEAGTKFADIVHEVVRAENGQAFQDEEGKFRFWNRQHFYDSSAVDRTIHTADVIDVRITDESHIINAVEIIGKPREKRSEDVIWDLAEFGAETTLLRAGADTEVWVNYNDPVLSVNTPVANGTPGQTSYFAANSREDGTGTNKTSSISLKSIDNFAQASKLVFTNATTSPIFLTGLTLYGRAAPLVGDIYYRETYGSSITAYEERPLRIESDYIQDAAWAETLARMILEDFSDPENLQRITIRSKPSLQPGDRISWQGREWMIYGMRNMLDPSNGFVQELDILQREARTYFRIGISSIGSGDSISP